jgi:hypothetical protein
LTIRGISAGNISLALLGSAIVILSTWALNLTPQPLPGPGQDSTSVGWVEGVPFGFLRSAPVCSGPNCVDFLRFSPLALIADVAVFATVTMLGKVILDYLSQRHPSISGM